MTHKNGWRFRLYPNGEFSGGYVADRRFEDKFEIDPNAFRYGNLWWYNCPELRRWQEKMIASGKEEPLDLSVPSNSHKRRGLNGITPRGSRLVRNTSWMLQKKYGRLRLSFLTLTVPPMSESEELKVCAGWSENVRLFCQWLKRRLESLGLPTGYVGVTEVQEKRWKERREVGLHLHVVFVGRHASKGDWGISPIEFRERWLDVLSHCIGRRVESRSCENVKAVKKSASGYLGKYMSKGVLIVDEIVEGKGEVYIPSSWYTCSMNLKRAFSKGTRQIWDDELNLMSRLPLLSCSGVFKRVYVHTIELHGRSMLVGIGGEICTLKARKIAPELATAFDEAGKHAREYAHMW